MRLSQPALPIPTNKEIHVRTGHTSLYARVSICYIVFISLTGAASQLSCLVIQINDPQSLGSLILVEK